MSGPRFTARAPRVAAAALTGLALFAHPAMAQQAPPPPTGQPAPQAPTGPALPLSMDQAVAMALENNLGLKGERLSPEIAAHVIAAARAAFLPLVSSSIQRNTTEQLAQRNADGTTAVASSSSISGGASVSQNLPWYGGGLSVRWSGDRRASAGSSTFNPQLGSSLRIDFTQPLWQDFRIDANRAGLQRAERQRVIADLQLEQRVVATEATVRNAYLSLLGAMEGYKVAEQNMELAQQSLRNAQARVKVGQSPEIEIITAEAAVESNRDSVIGAQAQIAAAEDNLRSLVLNPAQPDFWTVRIEPTDTIQLTPRDINLEAAIANALASRLDLIQLKRQMEITDLNLQVSRNATRPAVDLGINYAASGSGGRQLLEEGVLVRGFDVVLGDAFAGRYPSWTFGVNVQYPLGRSGPEAALAQGQLQRRQQTLDQQELELAIVQDVRQAARDVQTGYQRVQATQAARTASERQLEAEDRKFAVGLSDTFNLQLRQRDLAAARLSELRAMIAYNAALIQFDRVQKIQ